MKKSFVVFSIALLLSLTARAQTFSTGSTGLR